MFVSATGGGDADISAPGGKTDFGLGMFNMKTGHGFRGGARGSVPRLQVGDQYLRKTEEVPSILLHNFRWHLIPCVPFVVVLSTSPWECDLILFHDVAGLLCTISGCDSMENPGQANKRALKPRRLGGGT